jgi:hypothetical protein
MLVKVIRDLVALEGAGEAVGEALWGEEWGGGGVGRRG